MKCYKDYIKKGTIIKKYKIYIKTIKKYIDFIVFLLYNNIVRKIGGRKMDKMVCINIKEELYKKAKEVAKTKQLTLSALIRLALIEYINK